jgi:hypothetical protein
MCHCCFPCPKTAVVSKVHLARWLSPARSSQDAISMPMRMFCALLLLGAAVSATLAVSITRHCCCCCCSHTPCVGTPPVLHFTNELLQDESSCDCSSHDTEVADTKALAMQMQQEADRLKASVKERL